MYPVPSYGELYSIDYFAIWQRNLCTFRQNLLNAFPNALCFYLPTHNMNNSNHP